ncbi:MAG: hypothetical protein ISR61_01700 [Desulfobacteraceae bacterium]|uniref:3-hydroxyacyl-CoA dehydrogenase NAD binding domain-containing protein n=1 Tax=Candidatus Desulfacyla euxinica TaxID=2841693 RepID=A0A8J6T7T5_9DELT|nr:hypothetical protein [Candidatus Desulfacyla euxinica]MBL6977632.1 hypothetical protein [Desulfobacteraceae bacterium]
MDFEHVKKITILGQGVMGPDIALCFAIVGYEVTGVDVMEKPLERAAQKTSLNCQQMVEGGILTAKEAINAQDRITRTLEWEGSVSSSDFIMEAVPEDMETKQVVFSKCDALCSKDIIIASNTSSMSITRIASNGSSGKGYNRPLDDSGSPEPYGGNRLWRKDICRDKGYDF